MKKSDTFQVKPHEVHFSGVLIYFRYILFFITKIENRLEKSLGDFLWGNHVEGRKMYSMNWVMVCKVKELENWIFERGVPLQIIVYKYVLWRRIILVVHSGSERCSQCGIVEKS